MILYPTIDLKDGKGVRLKQGRFDEVTIYFDDPLDAARKWTSCGAKWLHVVDLDGAHHGTPVNMKMIERIIQNVAVPVQVGGGIRDMRTAEAYLALGAGRIVIGTRALEDPEFVGKISGKFPGRIAVGLDAKDGIVATRGWSKTSNKKAIDVAKEIAETGISHIIYTDIRRDGMLEGPNFEGIREMAANSMIPIIASGGITSTGDIEKLKEIKGVEGAILGRAIYEGMLDLREAIKIAD